MEKNYEIGFYNNNVHYIVHTKLNGTEKQCDYANDLLTKHIQRFQNKFTDGQCKKVVEQAEQMHDATQIIENLSKIY